MTYCSVPTCDVDLSGFGADDIDSVEAVFREISQIMVDDGIEFNAQSIKGFEIRKDAGYGGVRIEMMAKLDSANLAMQIDIGFGDIVMPGPNQSIIWYCSTIYLFLICELIQNTPWLPRNFTPYAHLA